MMLIAVNAALFSLLVSSPTLIRPAQARQLPAIVMQGTFMSKVKELAVLAKEKVRSLPSFIAMNFIADPAIKFIADPLSIGYEFHSKLMNASLLF